jgi:exosortase/archaeosortase family protein
VTRGETFFWLIALASLNAIAGLVLRTLHSDGLLAASFDLFGVSAIVWAALAAILHLLWTERGGEPLRRGDLAVGALVIAVALLPVATASAVTLTLVALWLIATSAPGSPHRRAALIALAATGTLIWGRLLLALFSGPMLTADAWLVALLTSTGNQGNILNFADGAGRIAVAPGCSSWQGMSLAILLWTLVNQWFRVPFGWAALGWCLTALAATIAVNVLRIAAMLHFPEHLSAIHTGWGWHLSMWTTLAAVTAICLYGARREVFR